MIYKKAIDSEYSCLHISGPASKLNKMRITAGLLSSVLVETPIAQEQSITFDISPQEAASALVALGEQADITVLIKKDCFPSA